MRLSDFLWATSAAGLVAGGCPAGAATLGAPPRAVPVVVAVAAPVAAAPRIGLMTPQTIQLRAMTPAEASANAIWSLRAGLNVAALQCQFSRYLATVRTYNDMLKHHSSELAAAQATMIAHFKRYDGPRALNGFDQYSTRIYNSYSTLDAQYAFCTAAAVAGRGTLLLSKGELGRYAVTQTPVLRASLAPAARALLAVGIEPVIPPVSPD